MLKCTFVILKNFMGDIMTCKKGIITFFYITIICLASNACDKHYLKEHIKDIEPSTYGLWEVGHSSFTVVDASRNNRTIKVDVWYPVDEAEIDKSLLSSYPLAGPLALTSDIALKDKLVSKNGIRKLIVFSHGYGGTNTQSTPLMETLASHNFIVASPEHTGNSQSSPGDTYDQAAMNRVPDISFIIDTMFSRNNDSKDMFFECINETNVGVVGHSFGGMTTIGMAAGWAEAEADPRVSAIAPISAVIDSDLQSGHRPSPYAGFVKTSLEGINVPVMLIGGTKDIDVYIENNALAFEWITKPPVFRVDIVGANHTHFANVCAIGDYLIKYKIVKSLWGIIGAEDLKIPYETTCSAEAFSIDEANRLQNIYVVSFFKRYLYDAVYYDKFLMKNYAEENESDVVFYKK